MAERQSCPFISLGVIRFIVHADNQEQNLTCNEEQVSDPLNSQPVSYLALGWRGSICVALWR